MNEMMPCVSILVPVYGVEKYIERCARSVLGQTYQNLEFVFVDDCTPDNSILILESLIADFPERTNAVHIIHHDKNKGVAATRNTLLDSCTGEFVLFVDSDDWIELDAVEMLVKRQQETNSDIVTCGVYAYDGHNEVPYMNTGYDVEDKDTALLHLLDCKLSHLLFPRLLRTSMFKENGIRFEEGVNMDEDFQVVPRLFYYAQSVSGVPQFLFHYNKTNDSSYTYSMWRKYNWELQLMSFKSYEKVYSFFSDKDSKYKAAIGWSIFKKYRMSLFSLAENGNREGFNYCKNKVVDKKDYWFAIRGGRFLRMIECNYFLMKVTYQIRLFRAKLLNMRKRFAL